MEKGELICRWQDGQSGRRMAASSGLSLYTVGKYLASPDAASIAQDGIALTDEELSRLFAFGQVGPRPGAKSSDGLLELSTLLLSRKNVRLSAQGKCPPILS